MGLNFMCVNKEAGAALCSLAKNQAPTTKHTRAALTIHSAAAMSNNITRKYPRCIATISAGFEKGDFLVREEKGQRV